MAGADELSHDELVRAFDIARTSGDLHAMAGAALAMAGNARFGEHPGRTPAFLHEAYQLATGVQRVRLAVALARVWVYGGDAARAVPFAAEAVAGADASGDAALLADALDAQLLVNWGPDDLDERVRITARLEDTVAHVGDVEARMSAHLWRMTTALEMLDVLSVRRQLRALDQLAEEVRTPRLRFFAAARQAMYALLVGDAERADALRATCVAAGTEGGEADTFAIDHSLAGAIAQQRRDIDVLESEAELYEEYATTNGVISVAAQAAELWVDAGRQDRAAALVEQIGAGLGALPRDVDWTLTVATIAGAAGRVGNRAIAGQCVDLLTPYAGRGVGNAGAVTFPGVVDDFLREGCTGLGRDDDAAQWAKRAEACYQRVGAVYRLQRLEAAMSAAPVVVAAAPTSPTHGELRHTGDGLWSVGLGTSSSTLREMKGFGYLRALLRNPRVEISALELSGGTSDVLVESGAGEIIDRQALETYRRRLAELDEELDEATLWADEGRRAFAERERDALLAEVGRATGLGRRLRQSAGSSERARVAVRKAVASAIERIGKHDAALARLLTDSIETGAVCRYNPDPARPVHWTLD